MWENDDPDNAARTYVPGTALGALNVLPHLLLTTTQ